MGKLISLSIDVTKINKERLFKGGKGTYLNLTVSLNDQPDKFGNHVSSWEAQSKEEREAKQGRNFLGNGKILYDSGQQPVNRPQNPAPQNPNDNYPEGEGLPF